MKRSELIETLERENPHLTQDECTRIVDIFFEGITQTLEAGARVELRGFGSFFPRHRRARFARNPKTGDTFTVPEKYVPFFRTAKTLAKRIEKSAK